MTFDEEFAARFEGVDEVVKKYLPTEKGLQKTVLTASDYSVKNGGKRIRPMLMQETFSLFDGRGRSIEPFMAAIEYIHSSSLVHDDLPCMDNDEYRRGQKSTWAAFGEDMGVLAGDALLVYAFETAAKALQQNASPVNVVKAMEILARKAGVYGMIGGQTVDVEMTGRPLSDEQLSFIYHLKTGALIEASMMIGAVMADASQEDIAAVEKIASQVGLAFQIQDDILDVTSSEEVLGKPIGSDEKNEKTTYVTLHGLEEAKEQVEKLSEEAIEGLQSLAGENLFLTKLIRFLITREK